MSEKVFRLYQEGDKQMIERLVYPRFREIVSFSELSDITGVELMDGTASVMEMARAMREASEYLLEVSKQKHGQQ